MANLLERLLAFLLYEEPLEVEEAIDYANAVAAEAQEKVDKYTRLLHQANQEKRAALTDGKRVIEEALTQQQTELDSANAAHQTKLAELNTSFQQQQERLENRIKQLEETQNAAEATANNEFETFVNDAQSRAQTAERELARLQSLLGGETEEGN
jgi:hypothetical protein